MPTRRTKPGQRSTRSLDRRGAPPGPDAYTVVVRRGDGFQLVPVEAPALVIGRDAACDIVIDDDAVSRRHARLRFDGAVRIADLGSRNGTFVRGERLAAGGEALVSLGELIEIGPHALYVHRAAPRAPATSRTTRKGVIVADPRMVQLHAVLDLVAASPLRVVILGETGAGKEVVARALHDRSPRAKGPFLAINCAALPESTLEAELFGYEKGAFTGAAQAKPGLFEAAGGGTVFLDEIAEISPAMQVKLLRVLEASEVMRLGSLEPRAIDVRIVSATNRDLRADVGAGRFRSDLYFRLDGTTLTVPPLRERVADIPPLAAHFAAAIATASGLPAPRIDASALAALSRYAWPGNVRELRNVIERAVVMRRGDVVRARDLELRGELGPSAGKAPAVAADPGAGLWNELEEIERQRIVDALAAAAGNQSAAAKQLGIARATLIKRIERFGLGRPKKGRA